MQKESKKTKAIRDYFLSILKASFPDVVLNGSYKKTANLNISIKNVDSEVLISKLTKTVISSGSACSSRELEPSSVLKGMGFKRIL